MLGERGTLKAKRDFWTLGRRISFVFAICAILAVLGQSLSTLYSLRRDLIATFQSGASLQTEMLANSLQAGISANDASSIEFEAKPLVARPDIALSVLVAYNAKGEEMIKITSEIRPGTDLGTIVADNRATLDEGKTVVKVLADHLLVATPSAKFSKAQNKLTIKGYVVTAWVLSQPNAAIQAAIIQQAGVGVLVVVLLILAGGISVARIVSFPLELITKATVKLAEGDASVHVPGLKRRDEVGHIAHAIAVFKDNARKMETFQVEQREAEVRAAAERRATLSQLAESFETSVLQVVEKTSHVAESIAHGASRMTHIADQTRNQAEHVSQASDRASRSVSTVAAAAAELAASISEIERQADRSLNMSTQAVSEATRASAIVDGLSQAAQRIGDVVSLINQIAGQTNLLALNATIEAARAGEAGKGFAVVAGEVKNLATQTAQATEEIGNQVQGIQAATNDAVAAIDGIEKVIKDLSNMASGIADSVRGQAAATDEISSSVQVAAQGTGEASSGILEVTQAARETGGTAEDLKSAVETMLSDFANLRSQTEAFLSSIR